MERTKQERANFRVQHIPIEEMFTAQELMDLKTASLLRALLSPNLLGRNWHFTSTVKERICRGIENVWSGGTVVHDHHQPRSFHSALPGQTRESAQKKIPEMRWKTKLKRRDHCLRLYLSIIVIIYSIFLGDYRLVNDPQIQ